ncbi:MULTISPECIES: hypothetical protein [unclassified Caballeronia]|uniref:hypothetical protein n=1 Tax=unclassified Caballeronia TaxID=2646786 RepID=UPI0020282155|nr:MULTISPECIES: hypothetical protein [unclassified Caballeronia]
MIRAGAKVLMLFILVANATAAGFPPPPTDEDRGYFPPPPTDEDRGYFPPPPPPQVRDEPPDFKVVAVHLDQTMAPKNISQTFQECIGNATCKAAVDAVAMYFGVDSKTVTTVAAKIAPPRQEGEESYFSYALPDGYSYCRSKISTVSITPADGRRASVFAGSARGNAIDVYTWTPKQGFGGGRSWVEADFSIIGVRNGLASKYRANGKCNKSDTHPLFNCRGAGTESNDGERPPCGSWSD